MKQSIFQLFCFFFILFNLSAFAGTTTLTTYYPPPTAAYNKVNLSTVPIAIQDASTTCCTASTACSSGTCTSTSGACGCCNSNNVGFNYSYPTLNPQIYACTGNGTSSLANGNLHGDSSGHTGTLHVLMNGTDVIYPPECYNIFCSYDHTVHPYSDSVGGQSCSGFTSTTINTPPNPSCHSGFNATPVNSLSGYYDMFQTSPTNTVVSVVCCTTGVTKFISTASPGSSSWPPDETTTPPEETTTTPEETTTTPP